MNEIHDTIALIEKGWTKGVFARNVSGEEVWPDNEDAKKFCVKGALIRACGGFNRVYEKIEHKLSGFCKTKGYEGAADFNDKASEVSEVIKLLKEFEQAEE